MRFEDHVDAFMDEHPDADIQVVKEVNRRIDQFAHFPRHDTLAGHRKFLHHAEGVVYFDLVYGPTGREAATQHIREDCGHIPTMEDYVLGFVDEYGRKK